MQWPGSNASDSVAVSLHSHDSFISGIIPCTLLRMTVVDGPTDAQRDQRGGEPVQSTS